MNYDEKQDQWAEMAELMRDVRREAERERERMVEKIERVDAWLKVTEATDEVLARNEKLREEIVNLQSELQEEKEQRARLEMQLSEMSKLSAGVAKKASQDELIKAIRVFVNKSKRKRPEERTAVKEMVLEMANANAIALPEDLAATIDSLDDEQTDNVPVTVNVAAGGINIQQANSVRK